MAQLILEKEKIQNLLDAGNSDAVLLYLFLSMGEAPENAAEKLRFTPSRLQCAFAALQQRSLWEKPAFTYERERPKFTENDLLRRMSGQNPEFRDLLGEVQRRFGRTLSTEETLSLLNITDYLGLPTEVVGMLLSYCIEKDRRRGINRAPAMRSIEKEAYRWTDLGICTMELAAAFMQESLQRYGLLKKIAALLQIEDRRLTSAEEHYILSWLELGFTEKEIRLAYEETMKYLSQFKWSYCNTILKNWHTQGLTTASDIKKAEKKTAPAKRNSQYQKHGTLSESGKAAIRELLAQEGNDGIQ
ncbi:MAG: DnaD domain protein [Clostridia bacterium]|nr:DnaD domain protein [Clostridia bacterium]